MAKSEIGMKKVELLKYHIDPNGYSYFGNVCQAICNGTYLCAAKTLHHTLVMADQRATDTMQRITAEEFLRAFKPLASIRHPNILLCLGTHYDPKTKVPPAIIMEYTDQNLTQYLESQQNPLSYETEFSLTCDVAQGFSFLHCNEIVHGNLSSNNVLIQRGSIAKIADFGMIEIFKDTHYVRNKEHSFSSLYLPLKLKDADPKFSFNIDVYAFGVLMVQILTGKRPEPDRTASAGSEIAARKNHWSLIDKENPLLQVALKCLADKSSNRPNFIEVCGDLRKILDKQFSKRIPLPDVSHDGKPTKEEEEAVSDKLDASDEFVIIDTPPPQPKATRDVQAKLTHDSPSAQPNPVTKAKSKELHTWKFKTPNCPHAMSRSTDAVYDGTHMYLLWGPDKKQLLRFGPICDSKWAEIISGDSPAVWSSLEPAEYAHSSLVVIGPDIVTVGGCNKWKWPTDKFFFLSEGKWVEAEYSMSIARYSATVTRWKSLVVIVGGYGSGHNPLSSVEILDRDENQWFMASSLPGPAASLSGGVCREEVWLAGSDSNKAFSSTLDVLESSTKKPPTLLAAKPVPMGAWSYAALPVFDTTLVVIEDSVYAVGGKCSSSSKTTNAVYKYSHKRKEWYIVGHMEAPRSNCFAVAVSSRKMIVVAGGISESGAEMSSVEVAHVQAALDSKL